MSFDRRRWPHVPALPFLLRNIVMSQRIFTTSCILAGGLLVKFGAPLPAVAAGLMLAWLWNWKLRDAVARML